MTVEEQILEVRNKLRLVMNGPAFKSMQDAGIRYKLNYGVELPRIKDIAAEYDKNGDFAALLWKQDVRECKILAVLVQPVEEFLPDMADLWVEQTEFPDLAEICSMYLYCKMNDASNLAFKWMADSREIFQYCGFLTMAHLLKQGREINERYLSEFLDQAAVAMAGDAVFPAQGARVAMNSYRDFYGKE